MTKEEIISILVSKLEDDTSYEWCECVRMIIKILNKAPCEDCISRQAVLELVEGFNLNKQHFNIENLIDEVENMPSVQTSNTNEEILVIRINAVISKEYEKEFRENIIRQKETGVIILPYFAEPIITPTDIEIKINEESEV